jgi:DHA3 family macrolide efflux protein-like MFS transporter
MRRLGLFLPPELRKFAAIWSGQLFSAVGTGLTEFALGVWVFQRNGSATEYALVAFCIMLPHIVLSPLAGALVDRWDRRWTMIVGDTGSALSTLVMGALLWTGQLDVWQVYLGVLASSSFAALQVPAYMALMSQVVPKQHLGRANGMNEFSWATGQVIAPLAAGVLVTVISVYGVMLIDAVTFLIAVAVVLAIPVRRLQVEASDDAATDESLRREMAFGWKYIAARPGLLGLVGFFFIINFSMGTFNALFTPLVLSFEGPEVLGTLLSVGSVGLVLGGVVMSVWGGPRRRVHGVLGLAPLFGLGLIVMGSLPWPPLIAAAAFMFFVTHPIINGADHALWQTKVPLEVQGRVFATRRAIENASSLLAFLIAGPLADGVFDPLLAVGGPLAGSLGQVLGVGPGRGIGLMFVLVGLPPMMAAVLGYASGSLRRIDHDLPDAVSDEASEMLVRPDSLVPSEHPAAA